MSKNPQNSGKFLENHRHSVQLPSTPFSPTITISNENTQLFIHPSHELIFTDLPSIGTKKDKFSSI